MKFAGDWRDKINRYPYLVIGFNNWYFIITLELYIGTSKVQSSFFSSVFFFILANFWVVDCRLFPLKQGRRCKGSLLDRPRFFFFVGLPLSPSITHLPGSKCVRVIHNISHVYIFSNNKVSEKITWTKKKKVQAFPVQA